MLKPTSIELVVRCGSWQMVQQITDELLSKQLISNAEIIVSRKVKISESEIHNVGLLIQTTTEQLDELKKNIYKLAKGQEVILELVSDNVGFDILQNQRKLASKA